MKIPGWRIFASMLLCGATLIVHAQASANEQEAEAYIDILALPQLLAAWKYDSAAPANAAYYDATIENRLTYGTFYIGLVAFLTLTAPDLHNELGSGRVAWLHGYSNQP